MTHSRFDYANHFQVSLIVMIASLFASPAMADEPASRKAAREDLKQLQGTWQCVAMEREGGPVPPENLKGSTATYEDDQITLTRDGDVFRRGIVTLDPSKTPKRVNTWTSTGLTRIGPSPGFMNWTATP